MRLVPALLVLMLAGGVSRAEALTIRDVIELTRAGLSDEVLLALIDVDGGVYANDTETLKALKEAGVSERVIVALVRSGRERRMPEPPPAPPDQEPVQPPPVVVIEHREPEVQQVVVPVPVYVPVYTSRGHRRHDVPPATAGTPQVPSFQPGYVPSFQPGVPAVRHEPQPPPAPVYWGFGGKLRPDAWGQPPADGKPADGKTADGKVPDRDGRAGRK